MELFIFKTIKSVFYCYDFLDYYGFVNFLFGKFLFLHFFKNCLIFLIIFLSNFFDIIHCHLFNLILRNGSTLTKCIILWILNKMINHLSMRIISPMLNLILSNFSQPKIVLFSKTIEYINSNIRFTKFRNNSTICTIADVNGTKLFWSITD
jgi:hypothetical protein